jgi:hypothetical protein
MPSESARKKFLYITTLNALKSSGSDVRTGTDVGSFLYLMRLQEDTDQYSRSSAGRLDGQALYHHQYVEGA